MGLSSWLYTNTTKQVLKIVHPGGHAELHDRPVLAAEIIQRNPKCCVAHPNVFQQPWAIVAPDTTLMPGQKFYVVPISTIKKLQRLSLKFNPSQTQNMDQDDNSLSTNGEGDGFLANCWLFKHSDSSSSSSNDGYCACLGSGKKIKGKINEESSKERLANDLTCSETNAESKKKKKKKSTDIGMKAGPPRRLIALENWHPGLDNVSEEIASA